MTMRDPADYADTAEALVNRASNLTGDNRESLLREAEIWARLAQAAAVVHAAGIQAGAVREPSSS